MEKFTIETSFSELVSDSQRYKTSKGEISMVPPCQMTLDTFEIFCIEGDLFEEIERYDTLEKAEQRIEDLLN